MPDPLPNQTPSQTQSQSPTQTQSHEQAAAQNQPADDVKKRRPTQTETWLSWPLILALLWGLTGTLWLVYIAARLSTDPTLLAITHPQNSPASVHQSQGAMLLIMLPMLVFGWLAGPVLSQVNAGIRSYWPLFFCALVVIMLARSPVASDDIYRYIHDGGVVSRSENPYRYAPASYAQTQAPDPATIRLINHPELNTIYLPFSQLCFGGWFWLGKQIGVTDMVIWFRGLMLLAQCIIAAGVLRVLTQLELEPARLGLYLCAPVALVEVLLFAHQDVLGIAAMIWALALLPGFGKDGVSGMGRAAAIGGLFALAGGVKPQALVMGLPVLFAITNWRARAGCVAAGLIVTGALWGIILLLGPGTSGLFETLREFAGRWVFNSSLHSVVVEFSGSFFVAGVVGWGVSIGLVFVCMARKLTIWQTAAIYFFSLMLFQPVAHPWYLLWALVFLPMAFRVSVWLYGLVVLWSYAALWNPAGYTVPVELVRVIHIPVLLLIGWEFFTSSRKPAALKGSPDRYDSTPA